MTDTIDTAKPPSLGDYLTSINKTKRNLMRDGDNVTYKELAVKKYPGFPINKLLSYQPDAIFFANELNRFGLSEHNLTNEMHYEFLLYALPKRNRFARLEKPERSDDIEMIMEVYKYSRRKAMDIIDLIPKQKIEALREALKTKGK